MNKIILLLLSILLLSYSSHAAFPIAANQTNTVKQVEAVAFEDTTQQHGFAQMAFRQYKHRIQKLLKKQPQAQTDNIWMAPLSLVLMLTSPLTFGIGAIVGIVLASMCFSKGYRNKGFAIATISIPIAFLVGIIIFIAMQPNF